MSAADAVVFPVEVTVRGWEVDRDGPLFPVQHQYVETLWLPVIGPSAMFCCCAAWVAGCWRVRMA